MSRGNVFTFLWSSSEPYWKGWQGFNGMSSSVGKAIGKLPTDTNKNLAQLVDAKTLKVIKSFRLIRGKWQESRLR